MLWHHRSWSQVISMSGFLMIWIFTVNVENCAWNLFHDFVLALEMRKMNSNQKFMLWISDSSGIATLCNVHTNDWQRRNWIPVKLYWLWSRELKFQWSFPHLQCLYNFWEYLWIHKVLYKMGEYYSSQSHKITAQNNYSL